MPTLCQSEYAVQSVKNTVCTLAAFAGEVASASAARAAVTSSPCPKQDGSGSQSVSQSCVSLCYQQSHRNEISSGMSHDPIKMP